MCIRDRSVDPSSVTDRFRISVFNELICRCCNDTGFTDLDQGMHSREAPTVFKVRLAIARFAPTQVMSVTNRALAEPYNAQSIWPKNMYNKSQKELKLSLIHISEPTRLLSISYAVFCLKKKKNTRMTKAYNK
eukprot:TRINITY_DN13035_c0_g1_i1.p1 TRINITY_DN13035_c0_g1~~TRINITY_DN13035_c0_g1_i1.p1  ORF type:complete len:133 (+),score=24.84 TRINITY_DN13035_c0_g1_i1:182-580(+)